MTGAMTGRIETLGEIGGAPLRAVTIGAAEGFRARILSYGARVAELHAPDRDGVFADVVLGPADPAGYAHDTAYLGAICGRYANRIRGAAFSLAGAEWHLAANEGPNLLHGGAGGFHARHWTIAAADPCSARLVLNSPAGDMGFPGACRAEAAFAIDPVAGCLTLTLRAEVDRATVLSLTHHGYWNLAGPTAADVLDHRLRIAAGFHTPVDPENLPTGEVRAVAGTPFDFQAVQAIGARVAAAGPAGYDMNLCLDGPRGMLREVADLSDPGSGRRLRVLSDAPALQLYSGGHLAACGLRGKDGQPMRRFGGVALEPQEFPDAPNIAHFPAPVVTPDRPYLHRMEFRLSADG